MNELEQRVKILETKVKMLEETIQTLKDMQLSEQMEGYIKSRTKDLKMVDLVNSLSGEPALDFSKENESIKKVQSEKNKLDIKISTALKYSGTFSEEYPDDPRYFNYEVEQGTVLDFNNKKVVDKELSKYVGKGLRITSYNGFDSERIIIPELIDGKPVISIGENAFKNASFSEVILPKTIKVIMKSAFQGCSNLKQISLPEGLEYIGSWCFYNCGLESIIIPDSISKVPTYCFNSCKKLETVVLGKRTQVLDNSAFGACSNLHKILLPETLDRINSCCFSGTLINNLIVPSDVSMVSNEIFASGYTRSSKMVTCIFLGKETRIISSQRNDKFYLVGMIYCLPGSHAQKFAREHGIPMKPLSEFRAEEYDL